MSKYEDLMKKGVFYITVLTFLFISCISRKQNEIVQLVAQWKSKEIKFPADLHFTIQGKDTVRYPIRPSQYTIITYVDSTGCTGCKLQLSVWANFIEQLDTVSANETHVLIFLHPNNEQELLYLLKLNHFNYPICIDRDDCLNKLNHFPSNVALQTFLLDKENRVIAIGNPIHNPKVKDLYLKIIQGEKVEQENESSIIKTKVYTDKVSISLGDFNWQKEQKATFTLKNAGNKPLVIQDVTTSCGCTSVEYSKEPVQPGASVDLHVTYKADHPEHFNKTLTVYCNAETSPIKLMISGNAN